MKLLKLFLSLQILFLFSLNAAGQGWLVVDTSFREGKKVEITDDGGVAVLTSTFLIKYDDRGNEQWRSQPLNNFADLSTNGFTYTYDNGFVIVGKDSQTEVVLFKLNSSGNFLWSVNYSNSPVTIKDIIEFDNNKIAITGIFDNYEILTFDSIGNLLSEKDCIPGNNRIDDIEILNSNEFIAIDKDTRYLLKFDHNLDTIWTKQLYNTVNIPSSTSNSIAVTDSFILVEDYYDDFYLLNHDGDSISNFSEHYNHTLTFKGYSNNNFIISYTDQVARQHLVMVNQNGDILWDQEFEGIADTVLVQDIKTHDNFIYAAGRVIGNGSGYPITIKLDSNGNFYPNGINARVFIDLNNNCIRDSNDILLPNIHATFTDSLNILNLNSNSDGLYSIPVNEGFSQLKIETNSLNNYQINCLSNPIDFLLGSDTTVNIDIPLTPKDICAGPTVFLNSNVPLRSCTSATYHVYYCNNGTAPLDSTYIELSLSHAQNFINGSIPWQQSPQDTNVYRFDIRNLGIAECGSFSVNVFNKCGLPIGTAVCATAEIYPDTFCVDSTSLWDMSNIKVEADCQSPDSIQFNIINDGSGGMDDPRGIIIVEDNVMYQNFNYQLGAGMQLSRGVPANGATWRLEAEQDTSHPFTQKVTKVVEGCGNGNNSTGFVNIMPLNYRNPFVNTYCDEVIGAYDPNDKKAFPYGVGTQHFISNSDPINYKIRFQNTGNDTAFYVSIRDTLSEHLKVSSVVSGASSHDYEFEVFGPGVLEWRFKNILLPDSNVNEPKSHGFVEFRVDLKPNFPNGTVIENDAAIYFDFNAPVITNSTYHTIGELGKDYLVWLSAKEVGYESLQMNVYPNPTNDQIFIDLKGISNGEELQIEIFDLSGKQVLNKRYSGNLISVQAQSLDKGIYLIRVSNSKKIVSNGKIIKL